MILTLILIVAALFMIALFAFVFSSARVSDKEFDFLKKIGKYLGSFETVSNREEFQGIVNTVAAELQKFLHSEWVGLALVNWEKDQVEPLAFSCSPHDLESLKETLFQNWRSTLPGHAILQEKNLLVKKNDGLPAEGKTFAFNSGIFIPLLDKENVFGILFAGDKKENVLSARQENMMELASHLVGPFVRNTLRHVTEREERRKKAGPVEMSKDLEIAKLLQDKMLPSELPEIEGIELAAHLIPAKDVSGDFYDIFSLREKVLGINMGDISGKSIPAALLVSMTKYLFRFPPSPYMRPAKLMEFANKIIYVNGGGFFVTDCFALFDLTKNQLLYVNAGHPPLLHYKARENKISFLPPNGSPLGATEEAYYREDMFSISRGDLFFFYSDGLTEIQTKNQSVLGEEWLANLFQKFLDLPPAKLIEGMVAEVLQQYEAQTQQRDDISCIAIKIL